MNSVIYGTVALAALVSKVTAHPAFYDERVGGCEIPSQGFAGHGAPAEDPLVVITVTQDGAAVTSFAAGEMYDIEVPAYSGTANAWIHASAGEMAPADPTAAQTAASCTEAAHSGQMPAAMHSFIWTAPETTDDVTISVAQATGSSDNYHTATMVLTGGGVAVEAAGAPAAAGDVASAPTDTTITGTDTETGDATGATTTTADADEPADAEAPAPASSAFPAATGALAAAAAAVAALAL